MTFGIRAAVVAGGVLGCIALWPGVADAQCSAASPDQTCSNAVTIAGPLQAQGDVGPDGGTGSPGGRGGNAVTINSGTISVFGASSLGGAGGLGGDGTTGGVGGTGGAATLTNTGGIAGAATAIGGLGGDGGYGSGLGGQGANGGTGGNAAITNAGSIGATVTVTGGRGGRGNSPGDANNNGDGGNGGDAGSASFTNTGSVGGAVLVTGGVGGGGGSATDNSGAAGGAGGNGGGAGLNNVATIAGAVTVTGGAGGGGAYGDQSGGGGGDGGTATLINSGSIGGATQVVGGVGQWGGEVNDGDAGGGGHGGNAVLINSGTLAGIARAAGGRGGHGQDGTFGNGGGSGGDGGSATMVNSGTISGAALVTGGSGGAAGTNQGSDPVVGGNGADAVLGNTGTILGGAFVTGGAGGDGGNGTGGNGGNAALNNWGRIFGGVSVTGGPGDAGSPNGTDGTATLNVYGGSLIAGAIALNGSAKFLNFFGGNYSYTLNTLSGVAITTNGAPYVVLGNTVVVVDPQVSSAILSANARALIDFTRTASDAVPVFSSNAPGNAAPLAFAGTDAPSRFDDAFAAVSGLASAYASDAVVFKAPTASYADGTSVWARGFAGQRLQHQDGAQLRNTNLFYGGMMGADFAFRPDLRYGAYLGGGNTKNAIDLNQGGSKADLVFGGAYARYEFGQSFLHAAVQVGGSRNAISRTVNNNLAFNGIETATGSFSGWYVTPEATFGQRWALGQPDGASYTLTPSLRLRYLYAAYGGYTETGTAAPLTVGSQQVSALEERGEVKLTRSISFTPSDVLSASLSAGVLGTQRVGGTTINAALLGQAIPLAATGQANIWGGFGGLGLEWRSRNVTLFSVAEYMALSDRSNVVSGRAGLRVAF